MKKFSIFVAIMMMVSLLFTPFTVAEQQPYFLINEAEYDGFVLRGNAVVPQDGEYYVRVTIFTDNGFYVVFTEKIQPNGDFTAYIATNFVAYTVLIVDRPDAFEQDTFEVYSWFSCTLLGDVIPVE